MATTTLTLTAAVRSHGSALPLFSGAIAMDGLRLNRIDAELLIAAYRQKIIPVKVRPEEVFAPNALDL
jgi:hypothetical protein